jgi:hypothetical protein
MFPCLFSFARMALILLYSKTQFAYFISTGAALLINYIKSPRESNYQSVVSNTTAGWILPCAAAARRIP